MKFEQLARLEREAGLRAANDNLLDDIDAPVDDDDTPIGGVSLRDGASKARAALICADVIYKCHLALSIKFPFALRARTLNRSAID